MKSFTTILRFALGALMLFAGIAHFLKPDLYAPFIPHGLPKNWITFLSGALEVILGVGLFIPRFRQMASLGIFLLMIAFLPLHVMDAFRDAPAIGSKLLACVRLPLQFVLIGWAWWVHKRGSQL